MHTIILKQERGIAWIVLNRPEIRNAVNYEMMEELDQALSEIENSNAKLLVLTGGGARSFCSGGDLTLFQALHTEQEAYGMLSRMGQVLKRLFLFKKPTVALLNGTAVGGGCELAAACDFRIAKRGAKFGFVQGTLAITTGWGGGTILYERIPASVAMDYLLSSRLIPAEKGYEDGFIHHLMDEGNMQEQCEKILAPYLKQSANVLAAYKQMWLHRLPISKLLESMDKEIRNCAKLWESDEHHEAVQKFLNK